jgi:hypothetical protein
MKDWIQQRINWLNQNIGSSQGCDEVDLPPLVISKIHYHPQDWWSIDGNRLEFIEITNNGDDEVNLTGVYFRELGITYQFPAGTHLSGREALLLCSDSLLFSEYYQITPFDQYTRKLSNKSENLVLADAWGNIIDQVHYSDSAPWPTEADGDGPFLQLKDLDSDNSLAENWTIGNSLTGIEEKNHPILTRLYPNPTSGIVFVELSGTPLCCQILNLTGNIVFETAVSGSRFELDLHSLSSGLYLIKIIQADGTSVYGKVVKH